MSGARRVPRSETDLTAAWIGAALDGEGAAGVRIADLETTRIGIGYGFASEVYRVALRGAGVPESVVVKLWNTEGPAGTREVSFYRAFGGEAALPIPHGHFGAIDAAAHRGVLVLADYPGATQGDCLAAVDRDRAVSLVEAVARVHARYWESDRLAAQAWLPCDRAGTHEPEWFDSRATEFRARFGGRLDPRRLAWLEETPALERRANELLSDWPETLIHGDLHLDNVLFERRTEEPVLLDWARAARGPGVLDFAEIAFMMGCHDDAGLVAAYGAALRRRGVAGVDETLLHRGLAGAMLRRFIRSTLGVVRWRTASAREEAMVVSGIDRIQRAAIAWERRHPEWLAR